MVVEVFVNVITKLLMYSSVTGWSDHCFLGKKKIVTATIFKRLIYSSVM